MANSGIRYMILDVAHAILCCSGVAGGGMRIFCCTRMESDAVLLVWKVTLPKGAQSGFAACLKPVYLPYGREEEGSEGDSFVSSTNGDRGARERGHKLHPPPDLP